MSEQLTVTKIAELDFRTVIYMEVTAPGGMGNMGGVVVDVFDGEGLVRYETNVGIDEAAWHAARRKVTSHRNLFARHNGGFGNVAYLNRNADIVIDEPNTCFIYVHEGKKYSFASSVLGVFKRVVSSIRHPEIE